MTWLKQGFMMSIPQTVPLGLDSRRGQTLDDPVQLDGYLHTSSRSQTTDDVLNERTQSFSESGHAAFSH
jgi:hypothetical protein